MCVSRAFAFAFTLTVRLARKCSDSKHNFKCKLNANAYKEPHLYGLSTKMAPLQDSACVEARLHWCGWHNHRAEKSSYTSVIVCAVGKTLSLEMVAHSIVLCLFLCSVSPLVVMPSLQITEYREQYNTKMQ